MYLQESTAFITVKITDVNDNQPQIDVAYKTANGRPEIYEDAAVGQKIADLTVQERYFVALHVFFPFSSLFAFFSLSIVLSFLAFLSHSLYLSTYLFLLILNLRSCYLYFSGIKFIFKLQMYVCLSLRFKLLRIK